MGIRTRLSTTMKIIRATGALHNLATVLQDPIPVEGLETFPDREEEPIWMMVMKQKNNLMRLQLDCKGLLGATTYFSKLQ